MSTTPIRAAKPLPVALRWLAALQEAELPRMKPGRPSILAVASVLVVWADVNGRRCSPSVPTIVRESGTSDPSAHTAMRWLGHPWPYDVKSAQLEQIVDLAHRAIYDKRR